MQFYAEIRRRDRTRAVIGATPTNAPIWVVEERKLLKKHSLDGEIVSISANESLERAYKDFAPMFPENLLVTPDGVKTLLDDLAAKNPKLADAYPESFIDTNLVQEVEGSGFLRQLYQR